jgi:uncharacterized protein (TIGR02246 family)
MQILLIILFFQLSFLSVDGQSKLSGQDLGAIERIEETYRTAWLRNDEQTILALFWEEAALYPNGGSPVKGKAKIRAFWFAPSETVTSIDAYETRIDEIEGGNNLAYLIGKNEIHWSTGKRNSIEKKRFVSKGTFLVIYQKRNRDWKIWRQFWSARTEEVK